MPITLSMNGEVALVTGGSGGIGSAICQKLAEAGASVIITYNSNLEKAQALLATLPGNKNLLAQVSITDTAALKALSKTIKAKYGRLDLLVNNAGITRSVPHAELDALDDNLIDDIFQTNFRGSFACVRAMQSLLKKGGSGVIINISSIAGSSGIGSNIAYCASKAALNSMTISLGRALAPEIRVVAIAPGWVDGDYAKQAAPQYLQAQIAKTPLNRLAQAEDIAQTVLAVTKLMPFSTGCIIPVDGGRLYN